MTNESIGELALEAWGLHHRTTFAEPKIRLTRPSVPILYFGDLDAYRASSVRVVTVGVNPSGEEFPIRAPWSRFPCAEIAEGNGDLRALLPQYLSVLNEYFHHHPYDRWFKRSYEPVLNGLGASYYGGGAITAIHTDICSPLATSPTWRLLEPREKRELTAGGVPLWHLLVEELEPHVILASISASHCARINLAATSRAQVIYTVEQRRPCQIVAQHVRIGCCEAVLVCGAAATTPFQMINDDDKRAVGAVVRTLAND